MMKRPYLHQLVILNFVLVFYSGSVSAGEHLIIPKFGVLERNDNTAHHIDANSFDFDDDRVAAPGFTYLYKVDTGFAFGVEVFGYQNEIIRTDNNDGDTTTGHVYGVVQKFFNQDGTIQPFIGIGLGFVAIDFDADINGEVPDDFQDSAVGLSYELILGSEFKISDRIGMTVEYKYFDFNVDDDIDDRNVEIESDGQAVFVGVVLHI